MKYLSGLKINSRYARTFENNCAVISRTADEMNMGTCAYHLADGMTCPAHGVVKQTRPNIHRADPPKPDRNKLCPCGSVLKWKRCCGDPVRIAAEHERNRLQAIADRETRLAEQERQAQEARKAWEARKASGEVTFEPPPARHIRGGPRLHTVALVAAMLSLGGRR